MIPLLGQSTKWLWIAAIAGAATMLAAPLPAPWHTTWRSKLLDLGHIPLFAALTWALQRWLTRNWFAAAGFACAIALFGEVGQALLKFLGRSGDVDDFIRGAIGCMLAVLIAWTWARRQSNWHCVLGVLGVVALMAWPASDAGPTLVDAWKAQHEFPTLADFQSGCSLRRFECKDAALACDDGAAKLTFPRSKAEYPTVEFLPPINDWRGRSRLVVELDLRDQAPIDLSLTVKDFRNATGYDQRFNRDFRLMQGRQRLEISLADIVAGPKSTPLNLAEVHVLQMFVDQKQTPSRVWLRRIALE